MRIRWRALITVMVAVAGTMWLAMPAMAQEGPKVPSAHKGITEYKGPETCAACHPNAAKEVASSLHYQQAGEVPNVEGWPEGQPGGMMVSF